MTENMIDRVKNALVDAILSDEARCADCYVNDEDRDQNRLQIDGRIRIDAVASAIIAAMREPTRDMYVAANDALVPPSDASACWKAMIDAALKDAPPRIQVIHDGPMPEETIAAMRQCFLSKSKWHGWTIMEFVMWRDDKEGPSAYAKGYKDEA